MFYAIELKCLSHEDLSNQFCVDWLKAREAHFFRHRNLERSDLSGIPRSAVFGPIIYRPLKELGSPGKIEASYEPGLNKGGETCATASSGQASGLDPKFLRFPETAYAGPELLNDAKCGEGLGAIKLTKALADYNCLDPGAARVLIVASLDFMGTPEKLFWPKTHVYMLPWAEPNQMLCLVVAIKSETPCEPELLLFTGKKDHLPQGMTSIALARRRTYAKENVGCYPDTVFRDDGEHTRVGDG